MDTDKSLMVSTVLFLPLLLLQHHVYAFYDPHDNYELLAKLLPPDKNQVDKRRAI